MKKKQKYGFTIVELVVVIAVIAVLVAVLIPTFSNVINKSNESGSLQEAKAKFNELYAVDYSDGVLDGKDGANAIIDDSNNVVLDGYSGCVYVPTEKFEYTNDKYKCTATLNMTSTANEWDIQPID